MNYAELRSDTFTKPTPAMLQAMFQAEVGDDVFEEDETTKQLERTSAALFGFEAGLFCLSGTMANQIAMAVHCRPGDEIICDALSHVYLYEGGGMITNAHASPRLLVGDKGRIQAEQIEEAISPDNVHYPKTKLVCLENTMNKGGGSIYSLSEIEKISQLCKQQNLRLHLDGARLFNALVETKDKPNVYGTLFDSITICLSKGLGTPMGTVLLGNANFIHEARRVRKRLGGGWRQSGYLAAAGLYALHHHVERLVDDHQRAKQLGELCSSLPMIQELYPIETNIVIMTLDKNHLANEVVNEWMQLGVRTSPFGKHQIRLVTHLDFTDNDLDFVSNQIGKFKTR